MGLCCSNSAAPERHIVIKSRYKVGVKPPSLQMKVVGEAAMDATNGSGPKENGVTVVLPSPSTSKQDSGHSSISVIRDILGSQELEQEPGAKSQELEQEPASEPSPSASNGESNLGYSESPEDDVRPARLASLHLVDRLSEQEAGRFWIPNSLASHMGMGAEEREARRRQYSVWARGVIQDVMSSLERPVSAPSSSTPRYFPSPSPPPSTLRRMGWQLGEQLPTHTDFIP